MNAASQLEAELCICGFQRVIEAEVCICVVGPLQHEGAMLAHGG